MTSYLVTPVGIGGVLRSDLAERVEGWDLDAHAEQEQQIRDKDLVIERLRRRLDAEYALRARAHRRLDRVALALALIAERFPAAAPVVLAAREDIWRHGDVG